MTEDKDHSIVSFHWSIALLSITLLVPHCKCYGQGICVGPGLGKTPDPNFLGTVHKLIRTRTMFLASCNDAVGTRPKNACGKTKDGVSVYVIEKHATVC